MRTFRDLIGELPQQGIVEWIGVRPARKGPLELVDRVEALAGKGLAGDHYANPGGRRQVTLIQAEHLVAVASMLGMDSLEPACLRRNIVVGRINLQALKGRRFTVGDVLLEFTGLCHPCSRMETALGPGGYNALRGHGGITARVLRDGTIAIGDSLIAERPEEYEAGY